MVFVVPRPCALETRLRLKTVLVCSMSACPRSHDLGPFFSNGFFCVGGASEPCSAHHLARNGDQ